MVQKRPAKAQMPPPVREGQSLELRVEGLNHQGEGGARHEGFTLFVPGALPGELVRARVISRKKTYARALMEDLLQPSSHRVSPPCPHHGFCGGCRLQHLAYGEQLRHKRKLVEEALRRLGGMEVPVHPVLGMQDPWGYRNKAQVPAAVEGGKIRMGFYEPRSHNIIDLETCPVQFSANDEALRAVRKAVEKAGVKIYDEGENRGGLRHVVSRTSLSTGETLVILVTAERNLSGKNELLQALQGSGIKNLAGIVQNVNPRRGNAVFGEEDITLWGRGFLEEELGGLIFRISPRSFFQVNTLQAETLLRKVRDYADLTWKETVFDLYCGTGTIALYLSRYARKVIGVESLEPAVKDARENAARNHIRNCEFVLGKAEETAPKLLSAGEKADVVVVDPPRKGCQAGLLEAMIKLKPARIIYVSCNPASLARDLGYLARRGYRVSEVQPVDMFPHTPHVETVCLLERK